MFTGDRRYQQDFAVQLLCQSFAHLTGPRQLSFGDGNDLRSLSKLGFVQDQFGSDGQIVVARIGSVLWNGLD